MEKKIFSNRNIILEKLIMIIFLFTFLFSSEMRIALLGDKLGKVNYIVFFSIVGILVFYTRSINMSYLFCWILVSIYCILISFLYQPDAFSIIAMVISIVIPLLLIGVKIEQESFIRLFSNLIRILNVLILLITIIGGIDYLFSYKIMLTLSNFMSPRIKELIYLQSLTGQYRLYSLIGHPLLNTQLYLMYYVLNSFWREYYKSKFPHLLIMLIAIIGISLTASKTGFILIAFAILFVNFTRFNWKEKVITLTAGIIAFNSGIFANTIMRFKSGSLTTGRSEKWEVISSLNLYPIKFFVGYGTEFTFHYNTIIDWASAAFEYPYRMFSLELGTLSMLLIYFCIFVYPVYIFIKRRQFNILFGYLVIFIDVNTYNGIALIGDYMLIYCIYIFILLNLSNYLLMNKNRV